MTPILPTDITSEAVREAIYEAAKRFLEKQP